MINVGSTENVQLIPQPKRMPVHSIFHIQSRLAIGDRSSHEYEIRAMQDESRILLEHGCKSEEGGGTGTQFRRRSDVSHLKS